VTSEERVKQVYPKAEALHRQGIGWAIFFDGHPHLLFMNARWSSPDAYGGNTKSSAWVNAWRNIQAAKKASA
jgi:hypothetical protein